MSVMSNVVTIKYINQKYIEAESIAFTLKNILNPSKSSETSSFQLNLFDPFQNLIERQIDQLNYLTIPGTISILSVQFSNIYLEQETDIWIQFSDENSLDVQGFFYIFFRFYHVKLVVLQIDFDSGFQLSTIQSIVPVNGINIAFKSIISNQSIILSNCFSENQNQTGIALKIKTVYNI